MTLVHHPLSFRINSGVKSARNFTSRNVHRDQFKFDASTTCHTNKNYYLASPKQESKFHIIDNQRSIVRSCFKMEFYKTNVVGLILLNASVFYLQRRQKVHKVKQVPPVISEAGKEAIVASDAILRQFNWRFLPVYVLVFGADWLQVRYFFLLGYIEDN